MLTHVLAAAMAAGLAGSSVDTPTTDELAIERAARSYRIQVYDTFHTDRDEFDRRRSEWERLKSGWEAAGRPPRDVPELMRWLETATNSSLRDSIQPLPEPPVVANEPRPGPGTNGNGLSISPAFEPQTDSQIAPAKPATPVSSKATLDRPRADDGKPDGRAIGTPSAVTESTDSSNATPPTKPAGAASWVHSLGEKIGEDLNDFAITLAWKRASK